MARFLIVTTAPGRGGGGGVTTTHGPHWLSHQADCEVAKDGGPGVDIASLLPGSLPCWLKYRDKWKKDENTIYNFLQSFAFFIDSDSIKKV
jgi:hypothetical protein